ncbi:hypothetical protein A2U01_0090735, partial [Trifolium medium]|nr:hypothetical protein [Trifolium medium]
MPRRNGTWKREKWKSLLMGLVFSPVLINRIHLSSVGMEVLLQRIYGSRPKKRSLEQSIAPKKR